MTDHDNPQYSDQFHPWIYRNIVVLALILVLSAWSFFGGGYSGLALSVVSAFVFIAIPIPVLHFDIGS
jgi:hypothetical protein